MKPSLEPTDDQVVACADRPFISVIMPVYNNPAGLRLCLEALEQQTYPSECYEVIVIDNGSDEPVAALVRECTQARCISETQPGSYTARNAGLAEARGDLLAFTDSDCIPAPDWLTSGQLATKELPGAIIAGRIELFYRDPRHLTSAEHCERLWGMRQAENIGYGYGQTANLFVPREWFERVGRFDPAAYSGGDWEWCTRAGRAGARVVYGANVTVKHPARATGSSLRAVWRRFAGANYVRARRRGRLMPARVHALLRLHPPLRGMRQLISDEAVPGALAKAAVTFQLMSQRVAYTAEWVRLEFGGTPSR